MTSSAAPIRFGVIGAGWFASRRHIPDIVANPEAVLTALCRRDEQQLERLRDRFKPGQIFTDWRAMLQEAHLDAVVIATPHNLHYEPARAAMEAGLHVLLEKPMTVDPAEARELCKLARGREVHLAVALNPPYWAHCHRIREAIRSGRIGELEAVSLYWTGNAGFVFGDTPPPAEIPGVVPPTMYRADPDQCGGGYLSDGGPHLISELLWTTGLRAVRVSCLMDVTPSDRRAALTIQLENGAMCSITSLGDSRNAARRVRNTFGGSLGTITVEGFEFETTVPDSPSVSVCFKESDLPPVPGPVANLIDAIRGRAAVVSPPEHGAHVQEVIDAAYRSATSGKTVALS